MTSWRDDDFKKCFEDLPNHVQDLADKTYERWKEDSNHPSLHFKHLSDNIWSIRVGDGHRAMGIKSDDEIIWFWIGSHSDYNNLYGKTKKISKGQKMRQKKNKPTPTQQKPSSKKNIKKDGS